MPDPAPVTSTRRPSSSLIPASYRRKVHGMEWRDVLGLSDVEAAAERLRAVGVETPLQLSHRLSEQYGASVYLKREDLQAVRSYKIRGAYNFIAGLPPERLKAGVVCASAGNHAQGVAWSCRHLAVPGVVFQSAMTSATAGSSGLTGLTRANRPGWARCTSAA